MALQGDLKSFALPDVLRLLAGTGKSGHLEVTAASGSGSVVLRKGQIAQASSTAAPRADDPSDVVFELLRLADGSFSFAEVDVSDKGLQADVDTTIAQAEALVVEWAEIEAVVPSMDAWLSLAPEVGDEVIISVPTWQALAAIGGGGNVHDLAAALQLSDLAASRQVMELIDAQLVHIRPIHGYQPSRTDLEDFDQFEPFDQGEDQLADPITDLADLVSEDRPVLMEDRDDALLPEPLPGEGVAYGGESITGIVDGRTFDGFEAFESLASFEEAAAMSEHIGEPGTIEGFGDADPFFPADPDGFDSEISAETDADGVDVLAEVMDHHDVAPVATPVATPVIDDERDSLLRFLSSVKP